MRPVHFDECNPPLVPLSPDIPTSYPWATLAFSYTSSLGTIFVRATYFMTDTGDTGMNLT